MSQFIYVSVSPGAVANNPFIRFGRHLHITGPEPLTAFDAVQRAEEETGRRFRVQRIPTAALKFLSVVLRPAAPIPASLMAMASSGAEEDVQGTPLPGHPIHRTTFREYVRAAMGATHEP